MVKVIWKKWHLNRPKAAVKNVGLCSTSDVITFDQKRNTYTQGYAGGKDLSSDIQSTAYTKTIILLRLSQYFRMIPSTLSQGLFDNVHFAFGE